MGGNNLFQILFASIKAKIVPLVTKIRLWFSWNFIRTRLVASIRRFFVNLFDVRPKHKKDYYHIFGWLVSKRLAFAVVVTVGVLSICYLASVYSTVGKTKQSDPIKTYSYDSVLLRMAKGTVRITGEGGYLAYNGNVEKGYVTGSGSLYNREGTLVYQGSFEKNCYEGTGRQYYDSGAVHYQGDFSKNLYEGSGKLYRENGTICYEGEFVKGMKDGVGTLYDDGNNVIYEGNFSRDQLVYSELLGKSTAEVTEVYSGERILYEGEDEFFVHLKDIDAAYAAAAESNTLDEEIKIERVYILRDKFQAGNETLTKPSELKEYLGEVDYEGNSSVTMAEAVCFELPGNHAGKVSLDLTQEFEDYFRINGFAEDFEVYLYSFRKDGLIYTFVCEDKESSFAFYFIEKAEGGDEA